MSESPDNPGPLPAPDLRNKSDGGKGPLGKKDFCLKDPQLVEHLQKMLRTLGYDIGTSGANNDGIDGKFGDNTEKAVIKFQEEIDDWAGNSLKVDGLVGPRTSDALNRAMVGRWYEYYQTPKELTEGKPIFTVTSDSLSRGLSIKPDDVQEVKIFLVGSVPAFKTKVDMEISVDEGETPSFKVNLKREVLVQKAA